MDRRVCMIDLHCHILHGIDDGPKTMDESLDMARLAVSEGITHILATPHYKNGLWDNEKTDIVRLVSQLQEKLNTENIPLTIFPGQEVRINGELISQIEQNNIQFIDEQEQYVLIEFPTMSIPHYSERLFYELSNKGITPVIVHPERNRAIFKNPQLLKQFIQKGALSQLTAGSYVGGFGKDIQKFSTQLIEANLVHFLASDAHNTTQRPFLLNQAVEKLTKEFGQAKTTEFDQVTRDLLNGDVIVTPDPLSVKKKKRFFF